jgi:hypothetical protein
VLAGFGVAVAVLGILYAKPIQDAYQDWKAERLVKEAKSLANNGQYYNAIIKAQEATRVSPDNLNAIRLNAEFLTYAKRNEALYFLDRLQQMGEVTLADRQIRVRALMNVGRVKEASALLRELFETSEPSEILMKLADEVWSERERDSILLEAMKAYAAKHGEDRAQSLRLARTQALSKTDSEVAAGIRRALELGAGDDDVGLEALEFLDASFPNLAPDDALFLIKRLRQHPKGTARDHVAALRREARMNPSRKNALVQEAIDEARGKSRDDLVPLVRWLVEDGQYLQVLSLITEDEAKTYQPLLENYLTALTMLQRYDQLERLVNDAQVGKLLNQSVRAFYQAHLAFVTRKSPAVIREHLIAARNAADQEHRGELLLKIAEYAEARGYPDIAEAAFKSASTNRRTEREGYHGLLRTAQSNGDTEALLKAAQEATTRWPDDQTYTEQFVYTSLLAGSDMETAMKSAQRLLDLQPNDHARRLIMALACWRFHDSKQATEFLQNMELGQLTPGQQAVFAAIARDSGATNAGKAVSAVLTSIEGKARLLPEERALLERAAQRN